MLFQCWYYKSEIRLEGVHTFCCWPFATIRHLLKLDWGLYSAPPSWWHSWSWRSHRLARGCCWEWVALWCLLFRQSPSKRVTFENCHYLHAQRASSRDLRATAAVRKQRMEYNSPLRQGTWSGLGSGESWSCLARNWSDWSSNFLLKYLNANPTQNKFALIATFGISKANCKPYQSLWPNFILLHSKNWQKSNQIAAQIVTD